MSFESIKDEDTGNEDEVIHIVLSIDHANDTIEDIAVVLAPHSPLPFAGVVVPLLGGGTSTIDARHAIGF